MQDIEIGDYIAKGKYGRVYKATNNKNETLACKIMNKAKLIRDEINPTDEIELLKLINCPFIIKYINSFEYGEKGNERIYILMEYITGGDLFAKILSGPMNESRSLKYIQQIAKGISYLHENKIMHRDIKPENIMIDEENNVKIIDFGHAVKYSDGELFYKIVGTPLYLSPEIVSNKGYDYRIDIWMIGILYFEMVTGNPPFDGESFIDIARAIISGKYVFPDFLSYKTRFHISLVLVVDPNYRCPLSTILQMT